MLKNEEIDVYLYGNPPHVLMQYIHIYDYKFQEQNHFIIKFTPPNYPPKLTK